MDVLVVTYKSFYRIFRFIPPIIKFNATIEDTTRPTLNKNKIIIFTHTHSVLFQIHIQSWVRLLATISILTFWSECICLILEIAHVACVWVRHVRNSQSQTNTITSKYQNEKVANRRLHDWICIWHKTGRMHFVFAPFFVRSHGFILVGIKVFILTLWFADLQVKNYHFSSQ